MFREHPLCLETLETALTLVFWECMASEDVFPRDTLVNSWMLQDEHHLLDSMD